MPKHAKAIAAEMEAVWNAAEAENRDLTPSERSHMEELVEAAKSQHRIEQQIKQLDPGSVSFVTDPNGPRRATGGPGDVFVQSKGWQQVADPGARGQRWSTGLVDVGPSFQTKAGTLLESGQGAGWVSTPQVVPGVVDKLFEQLGVVDLLPSSPATTSSVRYMVEGTALSGAVGVPEGGVKPASDLAYSSVDEPVKKVATTLTVSDELLDDGGSSIATYLNSRLALFVRIEEERQLLRGAGTK